MFILVIKISVVDLTWTKQTTLILNDIRSALPYAICQYKADG